MLLSSFDYGFDSMMDEEFLVFYLLYMLVVGAIGMVSYVLQSVGLYTIAKRRGISNPWLSWLPLGDMWMLGCISDQYHYVTKGAIRNKRKSLLVLTILLYVFVLIFFVMYVVVLVQALGGGLYEDISDDMLGMVLGMMLVLLPMSVVSIATVIIRYIAMYDLYNSCEPGSSVLYLVLSIFISFTQPIFFFVCRNKDLGMPLRPTPAYIRPAQGPAEPWTQSE